MKHQCTIIAVAVVSVVLAGCSDGSSGGQQRNKAAEPEKQESDPILAPDLRGGWQWPTAEVAGLTERAEAGDMEAADRLYQYYLVHEDGAKIAYWENWLFKRGHPGATERRAHRLYSSAEKRADKDPRKLEELREAERLWASVVRGEGENPFLERMRSEIASIEKSR